VTTRGVLVTGASGFIGGHVVRALAGRGVTVWAWTRNLARTRARLPASARVIGSLAEIPPDTPIDAIVNLAGAPVIGPPWTESRRRLLVDSRVNTTEQVIEWCRNRQSRPGVLISASAIGYYGPAGEEWLDETSPPQPRSFQSQLCLAREAAADAASALPIRVVNLRIGLVLGPDGGILPRLALPAKLGVAAVIGDGRQWMSWIHLDDLLRIIDVAIEADDLQGAVNAVAPTPVRQADFQRALTRRLGRPLWLRIPAGVLRAALGEMSELLVRGQRVAPRRLAGRGFKFRHVTLEVALEAILTHARS